MSSGIRRHHRDAAPTSGLGLLRLAAPRTRLARRVQEPPAFAQACQRLIRCVSVPAAMQCDALACNALHVRVCVQVPCMLDAVRQACMLVVLRLVLRLVLELFASSCLC